VSSYGERIQNRFDEWAQRVRRTTPGPLLVRVGLFVCALAALVLAWPVAVVFTPAFPAFLVLALLPALVPRGPVPTLHLLVAVVGWVVSTTFLASTPTFLGVVLLASTLYLVHTLAALAAVLPYDAVVAPGVLLRWVARAGRVLLLTAALALFVVVVPGHLRGRGYLVASLLGLALVAVTVGYLSRLVRRR
jgi:hypothetical protein